MAPLRVVVILELWIQFQYPGKYSIPFSKLPVKLIFKYCNTYMTLTISLCFQVPWAAPGLPWPSGGPADDDGSAAGNEWARGRNRDGSHHGPAQPPPEGSVTAEHLCHAIHGPPPHDQDELPPHIRPRARPQHHGHVRHGHARWLGLPRRDRWRPPQRPTYGFRQQEAEHDWTAALHPRRRWRPGTPDWE